MKITASEKLNELMHEAINAVKVSGKIIMRHYQSASILSAKKDGSPLTVADLASNNSLVNLLKSTNIPIISEEQLNAVDIKEPFFWLIDPLDGTKDFLARNDEFTINVGLIKNNSPILGVVYAPALSELYYGSVVSPAVKEINGSKILWAPIAKSLHKTMAVSRFHHSEASERFATKNNIRSLTPIGAALKYVRIAFGDVDVYPRMVGTSEWDTAAGQAILESVGGCMIDIESKKSLQYGKKNWRNGSFIAFRSPYLVDDFVF